MELEEEMVRALIDVALEHNWFDVVLAEDIAAALVPLAKRAQVEALREAHADIQAYTDAGAPFGYRPVEEFLLQRADRIENEGAGADD